MIELTAGFHPELTGEENIKLNGLLIGMKKGEIARKMKKIIKFANIGKFIDSPFYTYSSGMALRLGFSIAIHSNPDILVLDEDFNVGDQDFREKARKEISNLFQKGRTILMATHELYFVESYCKRAIWLVEGGMKADGSTKAVVKKYCK